MNIKEIRKIRTYYAVLQGWDLKKDFFELSGTELSELTKLRKEVNYSGKNKMGRSKDRQFWYYLQRGFREFVQVQQ